MTAIPVLLAGQTRAAIRRCAHCVNGMELSEAVDLEVKPKHSVDLLLYLFLYLLASQIVHSAIF